MSLLILFSHYLSYKPFSLTAFLFSCIKYLFVNVINDGDMKPARASLPRAYSLAGDVGEGEPPKSIEGAHSI